MALTKVLIVDDLEHVRLGLQTILELAGDLQVVGEACDGLEAIRLADQLEPDVVLMDLAMPKLDGLEATQQIKGCHPQIGVVIISIHDSEDAREQAARAGVDAFIAKGNDTGKLLATIRQVGTKAP